MLSALTKLPLPLPPLHHALLGLLVAACGFSASAREFQGDGVPFPCLTNTSAEAGGIDIQEAPDATPVRHLPDGNIVITLTWCGTDGDLVKQHAANLVLTSPPVPEPSYSFLGACAGCIVLLHRRRPGPGNPMPARTDLSRLPLERISSQCSARAPLARRLVDSHRLIARPSTGRAALRPLRAS